MSEENVEQVEDVVPTNALEMSDEEFANLDLEDIRQEVEEVEDDATEEIVEDTDSESAEEEVLDETTETTEEEEEGAEEDETEPESEEVVESNEDSDTVDENEDEIDYKAVYEQLTTPFKANGKEIQINNVDDAIALMQMGANYNKKMAGLKPNLKLLKMLDNNKLLNEEKLSFLIDLEKKDPEAIKKFIKDSGVDPLDINVDTPSEYKPNAYNVSDSEVDLDQILDDIRDTPSYSETIDVISNKWDNSSKQIIFDNPDVIKILNGHIESGVYQQINTIVESERMLGRLSGMSDIEAYKHVGDLVEAKGGFKPSVATKEAPVKEADKKTADPKLKAKKKAAIATKRVADKKVEKDFNPLAMTDEEIENFDISKYI